MCVVLSRINTVLLDTQMLGSYPWTELKMEPTRANAPSVADVFSRALSDSNPGVASANAHTSRGPIGGFLVCLDVPEATEFGIDYEVFRTGPKFQGVKFVPLGVHFVVFRSKDHEHGIRQGFFVHVKQHGQVIAREWSAEKEELGPPRLGLNVEHLEKAVRSFQLDAGLGPYPKQHAKVWHRLSQYISETVLQRCGVEPGAIVVPGGVDDAALDTEAGGVVPFFADQPRTVRFTTLRRRDVSQMTAAERTAYNFDKSAMLVDTLTQDFGGSWQDLLGEFQLAFVVFLQLSSLAALEQWKQMVFLLCSCESALTTHAALFIAFAKALRTQLQQIPMDFFEDEVAEGNFLRPCLASLLEVLSDCDYSEELSTQRNRLAQLLQTRFHFAANGAVDESEMDEFAPTFVSPEELLMNDDVVMAPTESNEAIALAFLRSQQLK